MRTHWIAIADAAHARIYAGDRVDSGLTLRDTLTHAQSRAHEGDLRTGGAGAVDDSAGAGRHRPDPQTTTAEKHADIFAKQLVAKLKAGFNDHAFTGLVIVAEPSFLGRVREHLDAPLRKTVTHTVDKDWTQHDQRQIEKLLAKRVGYA